VSSGAAWRVVGGRPFRRVFSVGTGIHLTSSLVSPQTVGTDTSPEELPTPANDATAADVLAFVADVFSGLGDLNTVSASPNAAVASATPVEASSFAEPTRDSPMDHSASSRSFPASALPLPSQRASVLSRLVSTPWLAATSLHIVLARLWPDCGHAPRAAEVGSAGSLPWAACIAAAALAAFTITPTETVSHSAVTSPAMTVSAREFATVIPALAASPLTAPYLRALAGALVASTAVRGPASPPVLAPVPLPPRKLSELVLEQAPTLISLLLSFAGASALDTGAPVSASIPDSVVRTEAGGDTDAQASSPLAHRAADAASASRRVAAAGAIHGRLTRLFVAEVSRAVAHRASALPVSAAEPSPGAFTYGVWTGKRSTAPHVRTLARYLVFDSGAANIGPGPGAASALVPLVKYGCAGSAVVRGALLQLLTVAFWLAARQLARRAQLRVNAHTEAHADTRPSMETYDTMDTTIVSANPTTQQASSADIARFCAGTSVSALSQHLTLSAALDAWLPAPAPPPVQPGRVISQPLLSPQPLPPLSLWWSEPSRGTPTVFFTDSVAPGYSSPVIHSIGPGSQTPTVAADISFPESTGLAKGPRLAVVRIALQQPLTTAPAIALASTAAPVSESSELLRRAFTRTVTAPLGAAEADPRMRRVETLALAGVLLRSALAPSSTADAESGAPQLPAALELPRRAPRSPVQSQSDRVMRALSLLSPPAFSVAPDPGAQSAWSFTASAAASLLVARRDYACTLPSAVRSYLGLPVRIPPQVRLSANSPAAEVATVARTADALLFSALALTHSACVRGIIADPPVSHALSHAAATIAMAAGDSALEESSDDAGAAPTTPAARIAVAAAQTSRRLFGQLSTATIASRVAAVGRLLTDAPFRAALCTRPLQLY
jgi:hypothetical protein